MPNEEKREPTSNFSFGDERDEVLRVAEIKEIKYILQTKRGADQKQEGVLFIDLPNGRGSRRVYVTPERAQRLLAGSFDNWVILGDYVAYYNRSIGILEALLNPFSRLPTVPHPAHLPGVVIDDDVALETSTAAQPEEEVSEDLRERLRRDWRLPIKTKYSPLSIQLQRANFELGALGDIFQMRPGSMSLYITGLQTDRHDDALAVLERFSSALFFELDLQFDMSLSLARRRVRSGIRTNTPTGQSTLRPLANSYAEQPVSLYFYARSAIGMPLLQYLAFYQAIEFFFPSFSNSEILRKLRLKLRDPRFDSEDDASLQDLASIANGTKRGGLSEREQLRITLEACADNNDLRTYISADGTREEFFTKTTKIIGTKKLVLAERDRLLQQVAERVYTIRCRIVHNKEGSEGAHLKALLPTGAEADSLHHDILLLQFLAQKVIISGSRGRLV